MDILVAGGTGFIGRALCQTLQERGHEVTALARSASHTDVADGVAVVEGDLRNRDSLKDPVSDKDAVYNLVSLSPLFKTPRGTTHDGVHRRGTKTLLTTARANGVERFIQMSGLGIEDATTEYLRAKARAERIVADAKIDWTIIRPSTVFGDGGEFLDFCRWVSFPPMLDRVWWPYVTPLPGAKSRFQPIWREDLVEMLADVIEDDRHVGKTYELGGPETYTLAAIVRLIHEAAGKQARLIPIPTMLAKPPLYIGEHIPYFPLGADQANALDIDNVPQENEVSSFGWELDELRTLPDYLDL